MSLRRRFGPSTLDGDALKTPLNQSLNRFASGKAQDAIAAQARSLPCTVTAVVSPWIVTVAFAVSAAPGALPQHTIPVLAPPYIALPIQVGDKGLAVAASVELGQLSGLGGNTPNLWDQPANLTPLGFVWLGNTDQTTVDPDAVVLTGGTVIASGPPVTDDMMLGFFGNTKITKQSITGALSDVSDPAAQAVLQAIVTALCDDGYGLTTDDTT